MHVTKEDDQLLWIIRNLEWCDSSRPNLLRFLVYTALAHPKKEEKREFGRKESEGGRL